MQTMVRGLSQSQIHNNMLKDLDGSVTDIGNTKVTVDQKNGSIHFKQVVCDKTLLNDLVLGMKLFLQELIFVEQFYFAINVEL